MNSTADTANAYLLLRDRAIRELRAENADLLADNARLHARLTAALRERDAAQRANRRGDYRGTMAVLWDWLHGRDER